MPEPVGSAPYARRYGDLGVEADHAHAVILAPERIPRPGLAAGTVLERLPACWQPSVMAESPPRSALVRLSVAGLVSPLGDSMAVLALILYVQRAGRSGLAVGLLLLADSAGPLFSPLAGALADRVDRRRLLVATAGAQAVVVAVIAAWLPPWPVLVVLVVARSLGGAGMHPALMAVVPSLTSPTRLPRANALLAGGAELGAVLGPPLAGWLLAPVGTRGVMAVDAASFVVAAALFAGLRPRGRADAEVGATTGDSGPGSTWSDLREGVRYLWSDRLVRAVTLGFWLVVLATAADDLALPFLGRDTLHTGPVGIGLLLSGASIGVVAGLASISVRRARRTAAPPRRLDAQDGGGPGGRRLAGLYAGLGLASAGNLLTAPASAVAAAVAAQTVRGIGLALVDTDLQTFLQRRVDDRFLGRVMGNVWGGVGVAAAISYAAGGPVLDATSPRTLFVIIGAAGLAATAGSGWFAYRNRRLPAQAAAPGPTCAP